MKEALVRLGPWRIERTLGRDQSGTYCAVRRDDGERATLYRPSGELAAAGDEPLARLLEAHRDITDPGLIRFRGLEHDGDEPFLIGDAVDDAMVSLHRGRRPDPGHIRQVGAGLAAALGVLHDRGLVHGGLELDHVLWAPGRDPQILGAGVATLGLPGLAHAHGDVAGLGRLLCALVASWPPRAATGAWSAADRRTVELIRLIADPGAAISMRKVRALLADEPAPAGSAGGPAEPVPADHGPDGLDIAPDQPGGRLGRYRILSRLGCGGMGEVFLAEDPALRRGVAIKRIRPALQSDRTFRARLRREAQLAAHLNHRAIVQVFDLITDDHVDHLIMEYVPGPSLHTLLAGGPMAIGEAVRIAAELADGLACAHQHGIVHRDLKLENILINTDGQPKITDFGIARRTARAGDGAGHESLTRDGFLVGTSRAMSPEQIQNHDVDARSDLFSFGVMLYELVTGTSPFVASVEAMTLLRILTERHTPACALVSEVPRALSDLIDHLLEKSPAQRPETARAVRDRLRRMLEAPAGPRDSAPDDAVPTRPITGAAPPADPAIAPARVECRQVALACIDLIAISGAGRDELADRELLADALPAFRARVEDILARSGGALISVLGHRFIACFGHTRPVDDAARRAVRAARAMLAAAAELRSLDPSHSWARFAAGGAIHAGLAVVRGGGVREELVLGATLDEALGLRHLGGVGDLWLSDAAARLVETEFQLERWSAPRAGIPVAHRLVGALPAAASGSGEHEWPVARERETQHRLDRGRRIGRGSEGQAPGPALFRGDPGIASDPSARRSLSSKIQAPFVLAQIRALRSSVFKSSPEIQSALAIAYKVEHSYDLRRADLFIPAGDTWCAILEPFAMTVLTGTLRRIGYEIFPQYVSILGIPEPDVKAAMDLRSATDLVRVICDAYSKCVVGSDAGTLTYTVAGATATVTDTTFMPCQLQLGVFLGAGQLTGLFRDRAVTETSCRARGGRACTYEFMF